MKAAFLVALCTLTVALAGCTGDGGPGDKDVDVEPYRGPKAELSEDDVFVDGMERDYVECSSTTHLLVSYQAGDDLEGDFTVNLYSESSRADPNSSSPGINVFTMDFSGADNGTFEDDVDGTAGLWTLEVHRSRAHDGYFVARLICAS